MSAAVSLANEAAHGVGNNEELIARVVAVSQDMRGDVLEAVSRMSDINRSIHLLSMNARTEAARVGAAGAGFAVVAEELTRLSTEMKLAAASVVNESRHKGQQLEELLQALNQSVALQRL